MAFQFKRDRSDNITLLLAGDIDLEVTPEIKTQLTSQTEDAASLSIDAANISYLDSSGVSILVISMQTCKQKQIRFTISKISEEAMRVLQLAKLDKILPVDEMTGPAELVDVDVFSKTGDADTAIASGTTANILEVPSGDFVNILVESGTDVYKGMVFKVSATQAGVFEAGNASSDKVFYRSLEANGVLQDDTLVTCVRL